MPARPECSPDSNHTNTWLFDLARDPYELCNLAESRPAAVAQLTERIQFYNASALPALDPPNDPAAVRRPLRPSWRLF
jgi:hypothetical protein